MLRRKLPILARISYVRKAILSVELKRTCEPFSRRVGSIHPKMIYLGHVSDERSLSRMSDWMEISQSITDSLETDQYKIRHIACRYIEVDVRNVSKPSLTTKEPPNLFSKSNHIKMHQETSCTVQAIAGSRISTSGEDKPAGFETKQIEDVDGDLALQAQGHDLVMERQFSWVAALGLAFSITNSWVGYLVSKPLDEIINFTT